MPGYSASLKRIRRGISALGAGMQHAQADMAALVRAQRFDLRQRLLVVALRAPHRSQHDLAGGGEPHAARQPVEQGRADLLLEVEDCWCPAAAVRCSPGRPAHRAEPLRPGSGTIGRWGAWLDCTKKSDGTEESLSYA